MISHEHRCIFIHIPRTAGTLIEQWVFGVDWWDEQPRTKHLIASQAKRIYADHWDDYFKFAFVRDPIARVASCLSSFPDHFGLSKDDGLDVSGYKRLFGNPIVVEHDHRFWQRRKLLTNKHAPNQVYKNIIDEELDFIGHFETLISDCMALQDRLSIPTELPRQKERIQIEEPIARFKKEDIALIYDLYKNDYAEFGYVKPLVLRD